MTCSFPFVWQRPGDSCQILGSRIPPAPLPACCSHEGKKPQLSHSHKAKKTLLVFENIFLIFTGFPLNCPLHLLHTLHFIRILFSNLVCVCALLPDSPGLEIVHFLPRGTRRFLFEICLEHGSKTPPLSFHIQGRNRGRKVLHSSIVAKGKREYFCQPST